jgi:curved DNA-binding protein CbpA
MDHFILLNEPRRPWLDADLLKQKFILLSSEVHPDRVHNANDAQKLAANRRYTELNAAYNCLREPKDRLRHLLELERGASSRDMRQPPGDLVDLSFEVGGVCRDADALIAESAKATSPMLKVELFERSQNQIEKVNALQQTIAAKRDQVVEELKAVDDSWQNNPLNRATLFAELETIGGQLGFFARWQQQLQERMVRLAF